MRYIMGEYADVVQVDDTHWIVYLMDGEDDIIGVFGVGETADDARKLAIEEASLVSISVRQNGVVIYDPKPRLVNVCR